MSKARDDSADEEGLSIDIDPALIEAALAAVDSRKRPDARPQRGSVRGPPGDEGPSGVGLRLDPELAGELEDGGLESEGGLESGAGLDIDTPGSGGIEVEVDLEEESPRESIECVAPARAGLPVRVPSVAPPDRSPSSPSARGEAMPEQSSEEVRLLHYRAREQQERVRKLEIELARMNESRDALDQQFRDLRQSAQKFQQDMELQRQRARKDRDDAERVGEERVLRGLLDIVDNVERGMAHAQQEPSRVIAGLTMISEQFRALLRRLGIERVNAARGVRFDPSCHEAVLHLPTGEVEADHVHSEVAAGFMLRGRLLRPARVVVASAPPAGAGSPPSQEPSA
jgi:molecular chaperone GrpE